MNDTPTRPGEGPLYLQVTERLTRRIADGTWAPGEALPSEARLAAEYGVSQGTLRKALDALAAQNLVVRQQGKGTFVSRHTAQRALFHFFHIVGDDGTRELPTPSHVLACRRRRATKEEVLHLALEAGARVVEIERVRDMGGKPAIAERIQVPVALFPDLDKRALTDVPNELYQLYEQRYGVTIHRAEERLRAVEAGPREAELLDLPEGAPLLEIERVALTVNGSPVERRVSRCDTRHHFYLSVIV